MLHALPYAHAHYIEKVKVVTANVRPCFTRQLQLNQHMTVGVAPTSYFCCGTFDMKTHSTSQRTHITSSFVPYLPHMSVGTSVYIVSGDKGPVTTTNCTAA